MSRVTTGPALRFLDQRTRSGPGTRVPGGGRLGPGRRGPPGAAAISFSPSPAGRGNSRAGWRAGLGVRVGPRTVGPGRAAGGASHPWRAPGTGDRRCREREEDADAPVPVGASGLSRRAARGGPGRRRRRPRSLDRARVVRVRTGSRRVGHDRAWLAQGAADSGGGPVLAPGAADGADVPVRRGGGAGGRRGVRDGGGAARSPPGYLPAERVDDYVARMVAGTTDLVTFLLRVERWLSADPGT